MYKPAFCILFFLQTSANAIAQAENVLADTLVTLAKPAADKPALSTFHDSAGEPTFVHPRTVRKRVIDSLKAADEFWYANAAPAPKKEAAAEKTGESVFRKRWLRNLLWVVILGSFIGIVIWYLVSSNIILFRKGSKPLHNNVDETGDADAIFSRHYEQEIAAATAAGNYRLAVRLWYLQTLKILAENGLIDYRYGRTNQDYVAHLKKHSCYHDFFRLTRHFEYTWYGEFPLSAEAYERMQALYIRFQKSLRG